MLKERLLIVEDDPAFLTSVRDYLSKHEYRILEAKTGNSGFEKCLKEDPDLVLLDWVLPDQSGPHLCERLRKCGYIKPIIIFTSRDDQESQVYGLDCGADSYWIKPVPNRVIKARVDAICRRLRANAIDGDRFERNNWVVDLKNHTISFKSKNLELSFKEFGVLKLLILADGKPVSRKDLLTSVWGFNSIPTTRTVDNYIVSLRKKLDTLFGSDLEIRSVHRVGYTLHQSNLDPASK